MNGLDTAKVISSKNRDDWQNFRNSTNILNKEIKGLKMEYIKNNMMEAKNNWKFLKKD